MNGEGPGTHEVLRRLAYIVEVIEFCAEELKTIDLRLSNEVAGLSAVARAELDAERRKLIAIRPSRVGRRSTEARRAEQG